MNRDSKNALKRAILWGGLSFIVMLAAMSVYGAFIGAERARAFFNSIPLTVYWLLFSLVLIAAILVFPRIVRIPSLLLMHAGCVLILGGAIWGSQKGHRLQARLVGTNKISKGLMRIYEGDSENRVVIEDDDRIEELPFSIRLKDFRVEYYQPAYLYIRSQDARIWKVPVEEGKDFPLDAEAGKVRILKQFENFKITIADGKTMAIDAPQRGRNPALEVEFEDPNGMKTARYVFERFPGHMHDDEKFTIVYRRTIADFLSDLEVLEDCKVVAEKSIEVNKPLHFGGYHFYQHSYDDENHQYTVLSVASDSGLYCVYAGYLFLCVGVFWKLWFGRLFAGTHSRRD